MDIINILYIIKWKSVSYKMVIKAKNKSNILAEIAACAFWMVSVFRPNVHCINLYYSRYSNVKHVFAEICVNLDWSPHYMFINRPLWFNSIHSLAINYVYRTIIYSQTCIKRSPFRTQKIWPYKTSDFLKEVKFIWCFLWQDKKNVTF